MEETVVSVPKALLALTLDEALGDLGSAHSEYCISSDVDADGRHSCDKQRERIDELRRIAGITDQDQ